MDLGQWRDGDGLGVEVVELVGRPGVPRVAQRALDVARGEGHGHLIARGGEVVLHALAPPSGQPHRVDRVGEPGEAEAPGRGGAGELECGLGQRVEAAQGGVHVR